jgi:hypothetical protein
MANDEIIDASLNSCETTTSIEECTDNAIPDKMTHTEDKEVLEEGLIDVEQEVVREIVSQRLNRKTLRIILCFIS